MWNNNKIIQGEWEFGPTKFYGNLTEELDIFPNDASGHFEFFTQNNKPKVQGKFVNGKWKNENLVFA